jgi:di/tricarboxylate transporter
MVALEPLLVVLILGLAAVLFVTEVLRSEIVALVIMALLMLTGLVTPAEGISGFSNPAVITILALFIISGGVYRTGIVSHVAHLLARYTGKSQLRILLLMVLVVGPSAAFLNNTAVVAILLPMVMTLAREARTSPSRLLMPLSYIAQMAGTITLIGSSTNLLASSLVASRTGTGFGMFEFSVVGLILFATGVAYLLLVGRHLIPARVPVDEGGAVLPPSFLTEVRVLPESPMVGKVLGDLTTEGRYKIEVHRIHRNGRPISRPLREVELQADDILLISAPAGILANLENQAKVEILLGTGRRDFGRGEVAQLAEVVVSPNSSLVRRTLGQATFAELFGLRVLGLLQRGPKMSSPLGSTPLQFGDTLLVEATPAALEKLRRDTDFIVGEDAPTAVLPPAKTAVALGITFAVVALAALGVYPILVVALAGAVLMVLTRVLRPDDIWRVVRWDVVFLLAGIIPLGIALENSGVAATLGSAIASASTYLPEVGIIMVFYATSMILTEIMSNNATVVLLVPVAFSTAVALGVNPITLVFAIMFAASSAFMTPIGYQTNLIVQGPGGYRYTDFTRAGVPLNLLLLVVVSYSLNLFFPLR